VALVTLLLLMHYTPFLAAFWGIVLTVAVLVDPEAARADGPRHELGLALTPRAAGAGLRDGRQERAGASARPAAASASCWASLTFTGLGFKFSGAS
jgi:TRAP-type uncharacterized transport system fused permease subunit